MSATRIYRPSKDYTLQDIDILTLIFGRDSCPLHKKSSFLPTDREQIPK
jgi:hypothetical protein